MQFPKDETGQILQEMFDAGFDFSEEYVVDFFALFHKEEDADAVAKIFLRRIDEQEAIVKVENRKYDHGGKESDAIELQISKVLPVTYEAISEFEQDYKRIAEKHNGYSDGWGVYMGEDGESEEDLEEDSYT
ncbi:ribonuclease E inhibitor RraB [Psychrosphaera sp. 1_MG-2023]|uniref:ribonuclease E inhibitor RraB n=1 Tax=Psychrosphaera sp. 1_MG-2023 TaxID=3062643 RepID=UPI0026E25BD6|nr:ribonuclease E inhibitor RraB [Psychrosphaera sp. 1_MG-2023]MDO6720538.1 ribonuclease E inhibitor RraB [Psychrosphaera sp. 1_MG-2023]